MAGMYTFGRGLGAALRATAPKSVLEWGPGRSSVQILAHPGVKRLTSIEHNGRWFHKYVHIGTDPRVNLQLIEDLDAYVMYPREKYDLIFVDGRKREECLTWALSHLADYGIVIIHDAERVRYHPYITQWPNYAWSPEQEVAVMSYWADTIEAWRREY